MQKRPTHADVTRFVAAQLPAKANDVAFRYHVPRHPRYDPDRSLVDKVILSITPTPGVYAGIGYQKDDDSAAAGDDAPRSSTSKSPRVVCFLHRSFDLDRRRVRRGTLVLSSHTSFDENLTVGWNTALAGRLGINVAHSACVEGYKGDPDRKIGIIGPLYKPRSVLLRRLQNEYSHIEHVRESALDEIHVVAIMNAFHAGEVRRVMEMAEHRGWVQSSQDGRNVLYLTGQPRESGLAAAAELGMTVVCVGHRVAEEWGIAYLATEMRSAFPGLHVQEVYEEEERREKKPKKADLH